MSMTQRSSVQALRAQILGRTSLAPAIDAAFSADPGSCCALATESVRHRFAGDCDIREVTAFVAGAVALSKHDGRPGFTAREAEAVIRIALGESELLNALDLADFPAAIDLDPNDASYRLGRGEVLDGLGRYEDAQAEYRTAAELDPSLDIS
jgi:tetratricopeptide (TPR) repeat protein